MRRRDYTIPVKSSIGCGAPTMIRLLIVDDQPAIRHGLRLWLAAEPDVQIVGEAADGEVALDLVQELHPDVVLMDMEMSHMDGIAAAGRLHSLCPLTPVIMLTIYDDEGTRARAQNAGVAAFVPKSAPTDMLLATIRRIGH